MADREEQRKRGLEMVMQSSHGRAWMYDLLTVICHADRQSHVPGDPHSSAFNEGARSVAAALIDEVKVAHPQHYLKMLEEALAP